MARTRFVGGVAIGAGALNSLARFCIGASLNSGPGESSGLFFLLGGSLPRDDQKSSVPSLPVMAAVGSALCSLGFSLRLPLGRAMSACSAR
jgi:hypothetical protein